MPKETNGYFTFPEKATEHFELRHRDSKQTNEFYLEKKRKKYNERNDDDVLNKNKPDEPIAIVPKICYYFITLPI